MASIAEQAHEPVRPGSFVTEKRHQRDRAAKWGTAKRPQPRVNRKQGKVRRIKSKKRIPADQIEVVSFSSENVANNKLAKQWLVTFNDKTKFMIISRKLNKLQYGDLYLDGLKLKEVDNLKQLGLIMNNQMTWDTHIREKCVKASQRLNVLKRLSYIFPMNAKFQIYIYLLFDLYWNTLQLFSTIALMNGARQ